MSPLSDIVSRLKISSQRVVSFEFKNNTKAVFPEYDGMKIYIAKKGRLFFKAQGDKKIYPFNEGDIVILSSGKAFDIFDHDSAECIDIDKIQVVKGGSTFFTNGGDDFSFIGCRFVLHINETIRFITALPEPIIISAQSEENNVISDFLFHLFSEIKKPKPGSELITEHLLQIILTQALRVHIFTGASGGEEGMFYALTDNNIGPVLTCLHQQPGRKWLLDELASVAGMSRSAFTSKFRRLLGCSVKKYIRIWRFSLAIDRMIRNKETISQIAFDLGYESESAFSTAFKKVMGESPRNYISNLY